MALVHNLLVVLLRWRFYKLALVLDLSKAYNHQDYSTPRTNLMTKRTLKKIMAKPRTTHAASYQHPKDGVWHT